MENTIPFVPRFLFLHEHDYCLFIWSLAAILEGLLLTPFQALWVFLGLYVVMPKMLSADARIVLKPHWIFAAFLTAAFLVFGYFCVFQMPFMW
jgi:hypothetical protein